MKIYRVHFYENFEGSAGFCHFRSRREAEKAAAEYRRETPKENRPEPSIEVISFRSPVTKDSIVKTLNAHFSYPDNG